MTYHDNEVSFNIGGGYTIISGNYTLTGYSVTSGQDPDGNIHTGLVKSFGSDGKISFRVGRKGSSDTADWFNGQVAANQTTFNHTADKLNFAFIGTLTMTITGGILGGGQATCTFLNVAIAQGHTGSANNWWFGGKTCTYIQYNMVTGSGTNSKGEDVSFIFQRGGNGVSTIDITPNTFLDTTAWMKALSDETNLDQIMMPGSHDAGMSELHHCNPGAGLSDPYTRTQSNGVGSQLSWGSRYFDIRVDYDHDTLVTYHRSGKYGCNGQDFQAVLDQTVAFLKAHPSETVILKISHIRDDSGHDASDTKKRINDLLDSYASSMYTNADGNLNLAKTTLGSVRGKMILVFDYSDYIDTSTGRFYYHDGSTITSGYNLTVYDKYSETADYDTMKNDQLQKWKDHGGQGQGFFFLLSWTLTSTSPPGTGSIESLAAKANGNLPGVLYDQIVTNKATKPNVVYIDFVNSATTQSIIQYNF